MAEGSSRAGQKTRYVAIIDQDKVTPEIQDIALKYDPLNRSGRQGFHVTEDGELHIDDANVIEEHKIVANRVHNDAIRIVRLPAERGELVHQYGDNGFRLYELPAPTEGSVVGLLGPNGIGKSTALRILAGLHPPNLGRLDEPPSWDEIVTTFRGTASQNYLTSLKEGTVTTAYKPQRVEEVRKKHQGTVEELIQARDQRGLTSDVVETFQLDALVHKPVEDLSGGELQRVALASTLVQDADTYLIDEPSSYLDVAQRLTTARALRELTEDARVVLVDHDLVTLDIAADKVHLCYGSPGSFGIVSRPLSARHGINRFLEGRLPEENLRIREDAIDLTSIRRRRNPGPEALAFPRLAKALDGFDLTVDPGDVHENQVLGILGQNGLGKTTFAKLIAGIHTPNEGDLDAEIVLSYKPQLLEPSFTGTVRDLFTSLIDVHDQGFQTEIKKPLDLEALWEDDVGTLSGGERQRVGIAVCLARPADAYLLDEPSAFLDVEQRMALADTLGRFVNRRGTPCMVIDHDLLLLDSLADRGMVFRGSPGIQGRGHAPQPWREAINRFLQEVGITFRRDPETGRPRANDAGSRKDREQKRAGEYFAQD